MNGWNKHFPTPSKKKKICVTALSKLATLFPWCPLGCLRPFHCWRTQNTVLSAGALVGWHWEHLWLEGRGGGGRGGWTEDTDHSHTNTALCPSTADGEGQICSLLPGKPVDVIKSWREEHRKADGSLLPGLYFYCHTLFEVQCLRATCLICPKNIIYVLLFFYKFQVQNLKCQKM